MIVTPDTHVLDLLVSDLVRSPGIHASDVYNDLFKQLDPKRYDYGDDPPNAPLMALGTAWEKHFEYLLLKNGIKAYRPDALISPEGFGYSPDLIVFNGVVRVGEIKLTSMSLEDMPTKQDNCLPPKYLKYMVQLMLYAYWLELRHGWVAILSIRKPYAPELRMFNLEWTERELQDNYRMCMNHAKSEGMNP
jgi:hypothetical protein